MNAAAQPDAMPANWSTQQLTGFLAMVSSARDERAASRLAVERVALALDSEVAALVRNGEVFVSIGFPNDPALERALVDVAEARAAKLLTPGLGDCSTLAVEVEDETSARLVVARTARPFGAEEVNLARGMARVLSLSLRLFRLAAEERTQRHEAEVQAELNQRLLESLQERQEMLARLSRVQRSIAHNAGRGNVLEAICRGALELLEDDTASLRLVAPDEPSVLELVEVIGAGAGQERGERTPTGVGLAGRAMAEGRLVVMEDYQHNVMALDRFREPGVEAGVAAPISDRARIVGSLVVGSRRPGRRYTVLERDMLTVFADHASLALADSRRIETMREHDAERSQARFRSLVQNSSDMIMVIAPEGEILYFSPSVERSIDLRNGAGFAELIHSEDRHAALEFLAEAAGEGDRVAPGEWRMRARDGGWLAVETIATAQVDDPGIQGIVLNSRDVTERKRLEAQLRQSQRLESVGQLAGGIAHDFNNFLSVIRGYAGFVMEGLPGDSPLRADAEEITRAADRATKLTNQLLVFSRHDVVQSRVLDLAEVLEGITSLLERTLGEDVALSVSVQEGLYRVEADPSQVEQVLVNLAVNARDAMPRGGQLMIELANQLEHGQRCVCLTVRDSGHGMTADVLEHAFEPFYSTKPRSQGSGLGLATVYGIATHAKGTVEIESTPGRGTAVHVLLPATDSPLADSVESADSAGAASGGETILVVEDDDSVRRLACRILSRRGYDVLEAPNGRRAMEIWSEHADGIGLLLTDVVMPGLSGKELAEEMGIPAVFMSGYTDDVMVRHGVEGPLLVQKPFHAETLLGAVRSALDGAPA